MYLEEAKNAEEDVEEVETVDHLVLPPSPILPYLSTLGSILAYFWPKKSPQPVTTVRTSLTASEC